MWLIIQVTIADKLKELGYEKKQAVTPTASAPKPVAVGGSFLSVNDKVVEKRDENGNLTYLSDAPKQIRDDIRSGTFFDTEKTLQQKPPKP